jgi:N-acetylmuramoyl-L-alanine amidase
MIQNIIAYLVKVIICSAVLMLYYNIALRNSRFHYYNRFYLLFTVLLSTMLPLLHLQWFIFNSNSSRVVQLFNIIYVPGGEDFDNAGSSVLNLQQFLLPGMLLVSAVMLIILIARVVNIYRLKKQYPVNKTNEFEFINTNLRQAPFSFLRNIFWRTDISLHDETGKQIMQHEITHIKQKHSWDKLFLQAILCFYWMNPFFWLLKKELYLLHEFIADEKAVGKNDAASFAKMLLSSQYASFQFAPAQSIFYSPIKRRLIMITTSKKSQFSYLRRVMVLPLLTIVICLFAFTVQKEKNSNIVKAATPFKLVVDAGHGGKDNGAVANGLYEKDVTLRIAEKIKSLSPEYGIEVVLTRSSDVYMAPPQKSDFANAQHADAVISVHVNAAEKSQGQSGFDVVLSKNNAQEFSSVLLGSAILQSLQPEFKVTPTLLQKDVGIWVLDKSILPAALIECGYLTNSDDAKLLQDDANIELIAKKILSGTALYANNKNSISPQNIIHAGDTSVPAKPNSMLPAQTPLYVLDGKIVTKEKADNLDPSSIEQVIVLKGKDATNKYGDKGKNGVVEIVLKNDKVNNRLEAPVPPPPPSPQ